MDNVSLKDKAAASLISSYVIEAFKMCIVLVSRLVLARLLFPESFGMFAVSFAVLNITKVVISLGLGQQLIRQEKVYYGDYLITELILSFAAIAVICIVFPFFKFYDAQITFITCVIIFSLIPYALSLVPKMYAYKELQIKRTLFPNLISIASYLFFAIIFAFFKMEVWALIFAHIISEIITAFCLWGEFSRDIQLKFSEDKIELYKTIWKAKYLYFISMLGIFLSGIDKLILGKHADATIVGFYSIAMTLIIMPTAMIENALNLVSYPLFSKIKDEMNKVKNVYKDLTVLLYIIEIPLFAFIFFNADVLVLLLLGKKWQGASLYLRYMSLFPILLPWATFGGQIIRAKGKEHLELIFISVRLFVLLLIGTFLTRRYGGAGMLITYYILNAVSMPYVYFINKITKNVKSIACDLLPIYLFSFVLMSIPYFSIKSEMWRLPISFIMLILLFRIFYTKHCIPILCKYYGRDKVSLSFLIKYLFKGLKHG